MTNNIGTIEMQEEEDFKRSTRKKYSYAMKTLIPIRKTNENKGKLFPSSTAGLFSFLTMTWLTPLMWKAFRKGITKDDLWELHENDKAELNAKRLTHLWNEEVKKYGLEKSSFRRAVWMFGRTRFIVCIILLIFAVIFQFLGPAWILKALINYVEDQSVPLQYGIAFVIFAFFSQLIRNFSFSGLWMIGIHTGMRLEGAMQLMTYEKMLRLRHGGEKVLSKAITFCTNDQERIFECVAGGVLVFAAPVMFIMSIVYSIMVIGYWAILGNATIFIFYPTMGMVGRSIGRIRHKTLNVTIKRVGLMTEILNSIRLIKIYAWEDGFAKKISEIRTQEENHLKKAAFLQSLTATLTPMMNIIASIVTFLGFSLSGNELTVESVFTIFSVFAAMQFTVGTLPFAIRSIAEASVYFENFKNYLNLPEFNICINESLSCDHDSVIVLRDANFGWDNVNNNKTAEPKAKPKGKNKTTPNGDITETEALNKGENNENIFLKNINIDIKRGNLIGVCGTVGSGKSSFFSSLLGEMKKKSGEMLIRGSVSVVTQQAWIFGDTFKENILFGLPFNSEKYQKVIDVCCLHSDLELLPERDNTLIGERGINLSGGQRQRLNLARSVYSDRSIYLMDDTLSAVDFNTAELIFEKCIKNYLSGKTIMLITHNPKFLKKCDQIMFFQNGQIKEFGTNANLMEKKCEYYNYMQLDKVIEKKNKIEKIDDKISSLTWELDEMDESTNKKRSIFKDDEMLLNAGFKAYTDFVKIGGGWAWFLLALLFLILFGLSRLFASIWLQQWLDAGDGKYDERVYNGTGNETQTQLKGFVNDNPDLGFYQAILASVVFITFFIGIIKGLLITRFVVNGASGLHYKMFNSVLRSPMMFFDATPTGRILNRFSKDMDEIDARLPFFIEFVLQAMVFIVTALFVIGVVMPVVALPIIGVILLLFFLDIWLNVGVRETKKLDNMLKSPLVHHLQSTMNGLSIIRTFNRQAIFERRFSEHLNTHLSAEAVYRVGIRWFSVRMDGIGLFAIFGTTLAAVLTRGSISSALVGLALSNIYMVSTFLPFVMRMKSELKSRFVSVERILEYAQNLKQETDSNIQPIPVWPDKGKIKFNNISLKYQEDFPFALNSINLEINGGEKIGIIGRTGSGKTSLVSMLLRLFPSSGGSILIDDANIEFLTLKRLRSEISVIPQDPVLFQGTIRYNVDPLNEYTDDEIWKALEKSNLKSKIDMDGIGLDMEIESEGENFSVGERQLLCLARVLLKNTKILVMDEATSSVDMEADLLIQSTVREAFANCTVLTIAHRINTVANYDKIIVLSDGKVTEYDTPENLMANKESYFYQIMTDSGISQRN